MSTIFTASFRSLRQWYRLDIIIALPTALVLIHEIPLHIIPDYFHLAELDTARTFIWSLITLCTGFSGVIVTILLVSFNFYVKSTRRRTIDYIAGNPWMKWLLSSFVGVLLMLITGYALMSKAQQNMHLVTLYILSAVAFIYIFAVFPMVIRSLKYANSLGHVQKLVRNLTIPDFQQIIEPGRFLADHEFEDIEGNQLMLLKELSVSAVKDGDWMLAQSILAGVFEWGKPLLEGNTDENEGAVGYWLDGWLFVAGHLRRAALLQHDHLVMTSIQNHMLLLYEQLNGHSAWLGAFRDLDKAFGDFCTSIIGNPDLPELRKNLRRHYQKMLVDYAKQLKYSDEALPTYQYQSEPAYDPQATVDKRAAQVWQWFVQTRMLHYFDWLDECIHKSDELIVNGLQFGLSGFLENLQWLENLTRSQQNALLFQVFYRFKSTSLYAIKQHVDEELMVEGMNVLRAIDIQDYGLVYDQLRYFKAALSLFLDRKSVGPFFFQSPFSIFRRLVTYQMDEQKKYDVLSWFIQLAFELKQKATTTSVSSALFRMIQWLFEPINTDPKMATLASQFAAQYQAMIDAEPAQ